MKIEIFLDGSFDSFMNEFDKNKVGCVFPMFVVSILPHAEFGSNDHREDAPHFIISVFLLTTDHVF